MLRAAEDQLLRLYRSRGIDVQRQPGRVPLAQRLDRVGIDVPLEGAGAIALLPHLPLQGLERGGLAVGGDPFQEDGDHPLHVGIQLAGFGAHGVELLGHRRLSGMGAHMSRQVLAGIGKEYVEDEADGAGGAFDIGQDGLDRHASTSRRGKRWAMSTPVKWATQPSGLSNRRMATKDGDSLMSNQCGVPAGTEMRSSFSQSTA